LVSIFGELTFHALGRIRFATPLARSRLRAGRCRRPGDYSQRILTGMRGQLAARSFFNLVVVVSELVGHVVGPLELAEGEGGRHEQVQE
jgi:hypothetical protein